MEYYEDWIQARYLDDKLSYKILRKAVIEAWDAIGENELTELLNSMPQRYQAVIDANGLYTKF
jgi:hypothetical protein